MKRIKHVGKKLRIRRSTVRKLEPETVAPARGGFLGLDRCTRKYSGCNIPYGDSVDCTVITCF